MVTADEVVQGVQGVVVVAGTVTAAWCAVVARRAARAARRDAEVTLQRELHASWLTRHEAQAAITALLTARGRMLDEWAEAAPPGQRLSDRQRDLWRHLHEAADRVTSARDQEPPPCSR